MLAMFIGYMNQTDIYYKLNQLPENRTELDPIKWHDISVVNGNILVFKLIYKTVLKITEENLLNSLRISVKNEFFVMNIRLKDMDRNISNYNHYEASYILPVHGNLSFQLHYLYQGIGTPKYFSVNIQKLWPQYSLISCTNTSRLSHCHLTRVCFSNSTLMTYFGSSLIYRPEFFKSIGDAMIKGVSYHDVSFQSKQPLSSATLFYGEGYNHTAWSFLVSYLLPIYNEESHTKKRFGNIKLSSNESLGVLSGFEKQMKVDIIDPQSIVCFKELDIYSTKHDHKKDLQSFFDKYCSYSYDSDIYVYGDDSKYSNMIKHVFLNQTYHVVQVNDKDITTFCSKNPKVIVSAYSDSLVAAGAMQNGLLITFVDTMHSWLSDFVIDSGNSVLVVYGYLDDETSHEMISQGLELLNNHRPSIVLVNFLEKNISKIYP